MNDSLSQKYDRDFIAKNIMGPNPMKIAEELLAMEPLKEDMTVLDLGCGHGVTSVFLAKEYGLKVFAVDLWISPTDNKKTFDEMGLTNEQIIPLKGEAHDLPFAEEFFDAAVSIDSYHYFGRDKTYLNQHLLPLVRCGGYLLLAFPGLKKDIHDNIPSEMLLSWTAEDIETLHDMDYWKNIIGSAEGAELLTVWEMECFEESWNDWLSCDNKYAVNDRKSMEAGAGKYMNIIAMILRKSQNPK